MQISKPSLEGIFLSHLLRGELGFLLIAPVKVEGACCGWGGSLGSVPKFRRCLIEQVPALCQELNRHHLEPSLHGADLAVSRAREGDTLGAALRLTLSLHHRRLRIPKQPHEVITVSVPILHICKPRLWEVKDNLSRGSGPEAQL